MPRIEEPDNNSPFNDKKNFTIDVWPNEAHVCDNCGHTMMLSANTELWTCDNCGKVNKLY